MSRDEWLEWRKGGITATEVADAANGTYGGAYEVVAHKLGLLPPVEVNDAMQRGTRWQERIADAVHSLTGFFVVGEETWCEKHDNPMVRATVDGFLAESSEAEIDDVLGVVEIKTRGVNVHPPRGRWFDQVQWQLLATGLPVGIVAEVAIDDSEDTFRSMAIHEVEADEMRQAVLLEVALQLWAHVTYETLPEPDAGSLDAVKQVHSEASGAQVDLTDMADDVSRLAKVKTALKEVDDEAKTIEARIRDRMADATEGVCDGYVVKVSEPTRVLTDAAEDALVEAWPDYVVPKLDRARFKKELKDVYAAHTAPVGARRFSIKETS